MGWTIVIVAVIFVIASLNRKKQAQQRPKQRVDAYLEQVCAVRAVIEDTMRNGEISDTTWEAYPSKKGGAYFYFIDSSVLSSSRFRVKSISLINHEGKEVSGYRLAVEKHEEDGYAYVFAYRC